MMNQATPSAPTNCHHTLRRENPTATLHRQRSQEQEQQHRTTSLFEILSAAPDATSPHRQAFSDHRQQGQIHQGPATSTCSTEMEGSMIGGDRLTIMDMLEILDTAIQIAEA